jgi:hypothetical protein
MNSLKLNPPKKSTFWTAVVFALASGLLYSLGCLGALTAPWVDPLAYLLLLVGFVLLVLGLLLKGV